ncbi:MAG: nuclear transport factor 2 family protein [Bacteroidota bacterium]
MRSLLFAGFISLLAASFPILSDTVLNNTVSNDTVLNNASPNDLVLNETTSQADIEAARVPLDLYMEGHAKGDGSYMSQAFHPDARIFWINDGQVAHRTAEEFASLFTRGPAPDEADRRRRIMSLDITGDVAVAKIELDYPRAYLIDYMSLIRVDGEWKIINKSYTRLAPMTR